MFPTGRRFRFGLVGPGEVADSWLAPALAKMEDADLWSVAARDIGKATAFATKHFAAAQRGAYGSFEELLRSSLVDAVIIATPDGLHARQAIAAARAGKHVFVEKPMATSVADAQAVVTACNEAGVTLGVGFHNRWHDGHRKIASLIRHSSAFGIVRHARIAWSSPSKDATGWRAVGDTGRWWSLAALGSHCLDLARWFMVPKCGEVKSVRALTSDRTFGSGRDESANVLLQFENGAIADISVSVAESRKKLIELSTEGGVITMTDTLGAHGKGDIIVDLAGLEEKGRLQFQPVDPYQCELQDFVDAIREGRKPEVDGEEGMRNVALLCMAEDDAKRSAT